MLRCRSETISSAPAFRRRGEKAPPVARWCNPCAYLYASYVVRVYTLGKEGR